MKDTCPFCGSKDCWKWDEVKRAPYMDMWKDYTKKIHSSTQTMKKEEKE